MFEKRTVFVIGAGGSFELGLPLGNTLKGQIAEKINIGFKFYDQTQGDPFIQEAISRMLKGEDINSYFAAGRKAANALPQAVSIDNFIDAHRHNPKAVLMGKLGIVSCINEAEKSSGIMLPDRSDKLDFTTVPDSWHRVFCQMAFEGVRRENLENVFDEVSIITFNYDRVIEFYIEQAVENYFEVDRYNAQEIARRLNIIHVYGQIGELPSRIPSAVSHAYGEDLNYQKLFDLAAQISVFTEDYDDQVRLDAIHHLLKDADVVVYLGFSYMKLNMDLLSLKPDMNEDTKEVFGTSLGIFRANQESIERAVRNSLGEAAVDRLVMEPMGGFEFLQNHWWPILYG